MPKQTCYLKEIGSYLHDCGRRIMTHTKFKLVLLFMLTSVEVFMLRLNALADTVLINRPGPWDDITRFFIWSVGPLDRHIIAVIFFFFMLDVILGVTLAIANGMFRMRKLSFALIKAAVYVILISVAWQFRQPGIIAIPFFGEVVAWSLEIFILGTEAISVITNADLLLRKIGTDLPFLRAMITFMERNLKDKQEDVFGKTVYDIMVVEDNPIIRTMLVSFLDNTGMFNPQIHAQLGTAIETVNRKPPDLVLLDLHLSDSSGAETFTKFQEKCPNIPVVILTGTSSVEILDRCRVAGARYILNKQGLKQADLIATIIVAIETEKKIKVIEAKVEELQLKQTLIPDELVERRKP